MTTYDPGSAAFFADPYDTYARMRRDDPVYVDPATGLRFVTRYHDCCVLLTDPRFSSDHTAQYFTGVSPELDDQVEVVRRFFADWMIFVDPPQHTRLRRLTARAFTPKKIAALRDYVQTTVDTALDRVADAGKADLIADLGLPVPVKVITHMLGIPTADIEQFKGWTEDVLRVPAMVGDPDDNVRVAYHAVRSLEEYVRGLVGQRRRRPTDDLLGILIRADEEGQILTEQELVSTCALLLIAAHETTMNVIGNGTIALLRNQGELARLRADPELIGSAIEELLRYDGPVVGIPRLATEDTEVAGQVIPAGAVALGMVGAANRDPQAFDDPDRLDIGPREGRHVAFSYGRHLCPGAALARLEARIAVSSLVTRFPGLALGTDELDWTNSFAVRGVTSLPVLI